jgi:hypothetical protein
MRVVRWARPASLGLGLALTSVWSWVWTQTTPPSGFAFLLAGMWTLSAVATITGELLGSLIGYLLAAVPLLLVAAPAVWFVGSIVLGAASV